MKLGSSWRKRSAAIGAICALSGLLALPGAATAAPDAPGAHASIIRGDVAAIADFPSLAFITASKDDGQVFSCTGTVIAPRVVLTAAHCVEDLHFGGFTPAADYRVATGRANPSADQTGEVLRVADTHVFPGFDPGTTRGDAAVLILATPTAAPPIPLAGPADGALYAGGAGVLLAGWGLTSANARSAPDALHATTNVVLDPTACKAKVPSYYRPYSAAMQMCTTDPPDRRNGGCFGDSGGPAIAHRADGSPVEIGIVSTGGPSCSTKLPNIFTRVDRVSTWAGGWIAATELGAPPPALKAKLPTMSKESAAGLAAGLLNARFGRLFGDGRGLRGDCRRLGPVRQKCELVWRLGSRVYFARVTVFYALQQGTVAWGNSYVVSRANLRCLQSAHSERCPVETRRG